MMIVWQPVKVKHLCLVRKCDASKNKNFCPTGDMFAFLGTMLRETILRTDALSEGLPVSSVQGLLDFASQDNSPMHRLFHSLASSRSGSDGPPPQWDLDNKSTHRTALGVVVSLEIMRKLNCPKRRYPLQDYVCTFLHAHDVKSAVRDFFVRVSLSSYEKKTMTIYDKETFDPTRAGVVGTAVAFKHHKSMKLLDHDNIGFSSCGNGKLYIQTVVLAAREFTEVDLEKAGVFRGEPSMEPRPFEAADVINNRILSGAFYSEEDVRCVAARWKGLLESALELYKKLNIQGMGGLFDTTVSPDEIGKVIDLSDQKVPLAPTVAEHRQILLNPKVESTRKKLVLSMLPYTFNSIRGFLIADP